MCIRDSPGVASASFTLPPGSPPGLAGLTVRHAFLVLDPAATPLALLASHAAELALVP